VALERLAAIADMFLVHDRPIVRPVDDSVVRVVCERELMLRRGRGYAPRPIAVDRMPAGVLALGGHLKTTVALTCMSGTVLSQHIGDLETVAARKAHARAVADATNLHAATPRLVVRDLHPDYASTAAAETLKRMGCSRRRSVSPGTVPAMDRTALFGAVSFCS
jgi:hydrogenase maturation protein HypF